MKLLIFTLASLLFASTASAGILIEPQIGYDLSHKYDNTLTATYNGTDTEIGLEYDYQGVEYGGRVGYQMLGLMGGLNYNKSSGDVDNSDGTTSELEKSSLGVFAGYNAPVLFRAWAGYNFSSKLSVSTVSLEGSSTEIGVGFTGIPFLSINVIFRKYDFTELTTSGITFETTDLTPSEFALTISAPFNLF